MGPEECKMVMATLTIKGNPLPVAIAITTAPTEKRAERHAREELKPYKKLGLIFAAKTIGLIRYPQFPTTIFLYVEGQDD